jgi:hypothetical protein
MTITLTQEEAQQVLDALENFCEYGAILKPLEVRDLLRARLAQPEPEPHGYLWFTRYMEQRFTHRKPEDLERIGDVTPVFAYPQKRKWQRLTDEELISCLDRLTFKESLLAAQEKLLEKNNG